MVSGVHRNVFELIRTGPRFVKQLVHEIAEVPLILSRGLKFLTRDLHRIGVRVVPGADEFDQFRPLRFSEIGHVFRAELYDHLLRRGMHLAHVCRVAETERRSFCRGLERFRELCRAC